MSIALLCNAYSSPHPINYNVNIENSEGKVIVYSNPFYTGGWVHLVNIETNELVYINASTSYVPVWYYVLSQGTWAVTGLSPYHSVYIDGVAVTENQEINIDQITTIVFIPTN